MNTMETIPDASSPGPVVSADRSLVYPPFFLAGLALTLTAGAGWGAWLLLRIARAHDFAAPSIFAINAHGQAQIYGWMGLFILGFAYQMFPGFWRARLVAPRLATAILPAMALAIAVRAFAEASPGAPLAGVAIAAGALQLLLVGAFVTQIALTARRGAASLGVADLWLGAGLFWFALSTALDLRHLALTTGAPDRAALLAEVAVWQLPLRDLQIHGLALSMIVGVSLRLLPGLFGTPPVDARRASRLFAPLQLAVLAEAALFPLAMTTRHPALFVASWAASVAFAVCAALVVAGLGAWKRPRFRLPTLSPLAFVRAAHAWLGVSLAMLVAGPFWARLVERPFSHAWYGATRHAITVGFVSLTIVAVASRIAPRPQGSGSDGARLPVAPFLLLNLGCALRVSQQVLTDLAPAAFFPAGFSGLLELSGLALWAAWIAPRLLRARRSGAPRLDPEPLARTA